MIYLSFTATNDIWPHAMMLTTDNAGNCHLKCFMICLAMVPCTHLNWLWMQEVLNASCIAVHQETDGWYIFLNFLNVPFCLQWIDLTHTMLLYCLIHFRFLKGMIWLRTLALLIFASYWLSVYAKRIRDGVATFLICSTRPDTIVVTQDCSKGPDLLVQWKRDDYWQSSLYIENNIK